MYKHNAEHISSCLLPRKIVPRPISQLKQVRSDVGEREAQVHHAGIWRISSQILFSKSQYTNYKQLKQVYEMGSISSPNLNLLCRAHLKTCFIHDMHAPGLSKGETGHNHGNLHRVRYRGRFDLVITS